MYVVPALSTPMLDMKAYCLLLLVVIAQVASVSAQDCFADMDSCVKDLRGLMTSENAFWFGQDYESRCVESGKRLQSSECQNPNLGLSVLDRFFNTLDVPPETVDLVEMADVVFSVPEGSYYGCGHRTYVSSVKNHRIDPLKITELNSWSLAFAPSITWKPKDDSTFYTVLVWDVGFQYMHGFYINAREGKLDDATPIVPYSGPKNPTPTGNVYLFVVIEQQVYADPTAVGMAVGNIINANDLMFIPTLLLSAIQNTWTAPVAVNLMTVRGDTYSAEWMKRRYIGNYCPWHLSMEDAIHNILTEAKLPVFWSYDKSNGNPRGPLDAEKAPYLHSLTVDLMVEYSSKELTIESCCSKTTYTETLYRVSPYQRSTPALTRDKPRVEITPVDFLRWDQRPTDKYYTLMMVDMSDAAYMRPAHDFNIHWLVTDIKGADVDTGNEVLSHAGPFAVDSYSHDIIVFLLFEQNQPQLDNFDLNDYVSSECPGYLVNRCGAKIGDIMRDFDLELAGINWFKVEQDAYARKMLYKRLGPQAIFDVCDGIPGFEDPCPVYGVITAHASALAPGIGLVLLVAVTMITKLL